MKTAVKPIFKVIDESTANDAMELIHARFPPHAVRIFDKMLANPNRRTHKNMGTIAYVDGRPVAMQCSILRKMFVKELPGYFVVSGMTCKALEGCSLRTLLKTIDLAETPIGESRLLFGNTCCGETSAIGSLEDGFDVPESGKVFHWGVVSYLRCARYYIGRKLFRKDISELVKRVDLKFCDFDCMVKGYRCQRLFMKDSVVFDEFMRSYLKTNRGLVSSRFSEDVLWKHGDGLSNGHVVALAAKVAQKTVGYILIQSDEWGLKWSVCDMIALGNNLDVLSALVCAAKRYLKSIVTNALTLSVHGFPDWAQAAIGKHLNFTRRINHNTMIWNSTDQEMASIVKNGLKQKIDWFFTPFDGDAYM